MASPEQIQSILENAVTTYDRQQSGKRGYNPNALAIYLRACAEVADDMRAGKSAEQAVNNNFNDRLLTVAQNAVRGKSMYKIRSKSTGSYFKSAAESPEEAQRETEAANKDVRNGLTDYAVEEIPAEKCPTCGK